MIEKFKEFQGKEYGIKLINKIGNFLSEVMRDEDEIERIPRTPHTNRVTEIRFSITNIGYLLFRCELGRTFLEIWCPIGIKISHYTTISKYIKSILEKALHKTSSYTHSNISYVYDIDNLTKEMLDQLEFSKEDYEIFVESERFGL